MTSSDPDQIRREIERTQGRLSSDVDALAEKVTPGRIVERRVDRVRAAASRWKDSVMGSDQHSGYPAHATTGTYGGGSGTYGGGYGGETYGGGSGGGLREGAQHAAGTLSDTASSAGQAVSGAASSAGSAVSGAASSAADAVSQAPQVLRRQTRGNPLAAGVIAFGAGWLISSLLPATQREQQLAMQAKDRAGELAQPVTDAAKQVAAEVKDNLQQPAQQAVAQVKETAQDAGRTVAEEGRAAAAQVQERAQQAPERVRDNIN